MLHGLNGRLRGAKGSHEDDRQFGVKLADFPERLNAVEAAHANVHDNKVRLDLRNDFKRLLTAGGGMQIHGIAENTLKRIAHICLIIDQ